MADRSNVHILLVDDEPSVLFALKLLLQALGYRVSEFNVAADALSFLQDGKHADMFLCDLKMPQMNGMEVLAALQSEPALKQIPLVFLSASAESERLEEALRLGASGYVTKPFNFAQLQAVLKQYLPR